VRQFFKCPTAFLLASFALWSQQISIEQTQPADRKAHLKVDTSLVLVPFTVTDRLGRPVLGLEINPASPYHSPDGCATR
jgi:hypothetical protein